MLSEISHFFHLYSFILIFLIFHFYAMSLDFVRAHQFPEKFNWDFVPHIIFSESPKVTNYTPFYKGDVDIIPSNQPDFMNKIFFYRFIAPRCPERIPIYYVYNQGMGSKTILVTSFLYETVQLLELKNAYVGDRAYYGINNHTLVNFFYNYGWVKIPGSRMNNGLNTPEGYKNVICPINAWPGSFGHWMTDQLAALMYIPKWVWELNPVLISNGPHPACDEMLKIFGVHNLTIIYPDRRFLFCERLFIIKAWEAVNGLGTHSVPLLHEKISNYYRLDLIPAEKYGYMNRPSGDRHFANLDEVISNISVERNVTFEKLEVNQPDLPTFYKFLAALKLLICPNGSILYNIIFMKKKKGVISLNAYLDGPNVKFAYELDIFYIGIMHHTNNNGGLADGAKVLYCFDIINKAIEIGKWPPHNLMPMINFKIMQDYIDSTPDPGNLNRIIGQMRNEYMTTVSPLPPNM